RGSGEDARRLKERARRGRGASGRPHVDPRPDGRERTPALRRARAERQRSARRHPGDGLLHGRAGAPRARRRLRSRLAAAPDAETMSEAAPQPLPAVSWRRSVLMGDPAHFRVQGAPNPHTRTRLGTRRSVDRARAISQWRRLRDVLRDHGLRVIAISADPGAPGLVYPANAGFLTEVDAEKPLAEKTFYLSNL